MENIELAVNLLLLFVLNLDFPNNNIDLIAV